MTRYDDDDDDDDNAYIYILYIYTRGTAPPLRFFRGDPFDTTFVCDSRSFYACIYIVYTISSYNIDFAACVALSFLVLIYCSRRFKGFLFLQYSFVMCNVGSRYI